MDTTQIMNLLFHQDMILYYDFIMAIFGCLYDDTNIYKYISKVEDLNLKSTLSVPCKKGSFWALSLEIW